MEKGAEIEEETLYKGAVIDVTTRSGKKAFLAAARGPHFPQLLISLMKDVLLHTIPQSLANAALNAAKDNNDSINSVMAKLAGATLPYESDLELAQGYTKLLELERQHSNNKNDMVSKINDKLKEKSEKHIHNRAETDILSQEKGALQAAIRKGQEIPPRNVLQRILHPLTNDQQWKANAAKRALRENKKEYAELKAKYTRKYLESRKNKDSSHKSR